MLTSDDNLMPIGTFAQRSGLTASALRFYADAGVLLPASVDEASGYRYYSEDQLERAVLLRLLREIGMPLSEAAQALETSSVKLVEDHVRRVATDAENARQVLEIVTASLTGTAGSRIATLNGPVIAAAVEQVLTASTAEPGLAVLNALRLETSPTAVTLTATDRYWFATRTLFPPEPAMPWQGTVHADDLRACLSALRRSPRVTVSAGDQTLTLNLGDRGVRTCRVLPEPYPDYRRMLDDLPEVTTRVGVRKSLLMAALEGFADDRVRLSVARGLTAAEVPVEAEVTGADLELWFEMTTLYPAVGTAIGADLLIELRGPALPATIRSADHGDLTTLAMPVRPSS